LHHWVSKQKLKPRTLTIERKRKLISIRFNFYETDLEIILSSRNIMYKELLSFKNEHGHPNVPHDYTKNNPFRNWVNRIRKNRKDLPDEKIKKLEKLGLDFKGYFHWRNKKQWNERYEKLMLFHKEYGHCNVPESNKNIVSYLFGLPI
jgi:Helicase associated domain